MKKEKKAIKLAGKTNEIISHVGMPKDHFLNIDFSMSWVTFTRYIMAVISTHVKKSYFVNETGKTPEKVIKDELLNLAKIADQFVKIQKRFNIEPSGDKAFYATIDDRRFYCDESTGEGITDSWLKSENDEIEMAEYAKDINSQSFAQGRILPECATLAEMKAQGFPNGEHWERYDWATGGDGLESPIEYWTNKKTGISYQVESEAIIKHCEAKVYNAPKKAGEWQDTEDD